MSVELSLVEKELFLWLHRKSSFDKGLNGLSSSFFVLVNFLKLRKLVNGACEWEKGKSLCIAASIHILLYITQNKTLQLNMCTSEILHHTSSAFPL